MKDAGGRPGTALFLSSVVTFVLVDFVFLAGPQLSLPMARIAPVMAYALLAGFALSLAVIASVALGAWRARSAPSAIELLRGSVALILVALHAALLIIAKRR
jgi:hypothetical protein